ncbi:MAG: T9SS type A sorting domain-containing protein, partial [Hymenobacteraceae bacterium]|nr:T9SS type A sorting domain-containing protein [Hymenobacteraceae bacterium]MDX5396173.1 T9SS type A sorting domain-containing protein [Hymenobacteraceae bacterium]MDX5512234.1 T9SS type A sorting domain-containing protein [Hymenobacteraceae bacterium]
GWDGNANSYSGALLNSFHSKPAFVNIDAQYTINTRTVSAVATITPYFNYSGNDLVAHMVITENRTVNNASTNGETEFFDVMKKMMPNETGIPLNGFTSRTPITINQSYTFPTNNNVENFDSLSVVVFVQDRATKEVFQADYARLTTTLGAAKNLDKASFSVYPNPTEGVASVAFTLAGSQQVRVQVVNTLGQVVHSKNEGTMAPGNHTLELDLTNQSQGIYIVYLQVGDEQLTKKVSLLH